MLAEIQLRFCSQPQPLWVEVHKGYKVPYQLHCWPPVVGVLEDEFGARLVGVLLATLDAEELVTPPPEQTAPFTVGVSAEPPFLLTWNPNDTVCPGAMLPFQPKEVAV